MAVDVNRTVWTFSAVLVLAMLPGCRRSEKVSVTSLAIVNTGWTTEWADGQKVMKGVLDKVVAAEGAKGNARVYRATDYVYDAQHHVPQQQSLERGATICRAVAVQGDVAADARTDIGVTIFALPGRAPTYLVKPIAAQASWREQYALYDVGQPHRLLVVIQTVPGQHGGGIRLVWLDRVTGAVEEIWGCSGPADGRNFAHEVRATDDGWSLVIHGIYETKVTAFEVYRLALEDTLGVPVQFVWAYESDCCGGK